ncbi:hypothetical protein CANINC_004139 [Pichia inconspicua]|uniref:Transcription initiation factor TFIID subunit 2 n=1 Tax=Pichia inconspicua TaxID=52247 RepID=A0A4T0WX95_9ASCO|nr:hypothetical protein CANINC_004139 [[Candida] inconspicua]
MEPLMLSVRATPRTPKTPLTPKSSKSSRHHSRYDYDDIPSQRFKVGYQKVTLDIDLEQNSIIGETEITILPQESQLKYIRLDCRGIQVNSIIVNQRRAQFSYDDFLQNLEYMNDTENPVLSDYNYDPYFDSNSKSISFHQHAMLRSKFFPLFSDQNEANEPSSSYPICSSELTIKVPESIKLRLQNSSKLFSPAGTSRSVNETPNTNSSFISSDKVYTPLNIKINYVVKHSKNGIIFHGGKHTDIPRHEWFCFTNNNDIGCSASSWVPCIDNFYEKPAWDVNIIVPCTVGDIGTTKLIGTKEGDNALRKLASLQLKQGDPVKDNEDDGDREENTSNLINDTPLTVVVPDIVSSRESPHTLDVGKKVINFQFYNPICAHHLGFAVGCFEKMPIADLKPGSDEIVVTSESITGDSAKDLTFNFDATNSNKVPTMLYYQNGFKDKVINSTLFLYKALDFYSKEFSSFPFTSYTLLFIEGLNAKTCSFAGMTIASAELLYLPNQIEPLFSTTEILSSALAEQYSGVNVLPKSLNDIWLTQGIAYYMSSQFLRKLFGVNHYRFTFRKRCEQLCDIDVGKRPLANQTFCFPINLDQDMDFIRLKAPLVLTILDRRITKTDKLFGLSRVLPKIFLQAMSNDLVNGNALSTIHFQKVCEKVAHHKLETFFQNWVHKAGVPILRVSQKFNKKRLFIEMTIRQMQTSVLNNEEDNIFDKGTVTHDRELGFVQEANTAIVEEEHFPPQTTFSGPITVRIHEVDGSPYEHIMAISDTVTKLDIQYNTKYRRRKKDKKEEDDEANEKEKEKEKEKERDSKRKEKEKNDSRPKMLGDVLTSSEELTNWGLREDENLANNQEDKNDRLNDEDDAFEWLRFDADSEWICNYSINLTDKNFESQLKQDRDVNAQLESVRHFSSVSRPDISHARVLLRTLIDRRYYYGVRVEAAKALSKISSEENDHIGMRLLLKAYKYLYCIDNKISPSLNELDFREYVPKPNDFSDFSNLFVSQAIIESISQVRNKNGDAPIELKKILLHILKYIDNSGNKFDDSNYYCSLIRSVSSLVLCSNTEIKDLSVDNTTKSFQFNDAKEEFVFNAIKELNRCLKMDEWSPSYQRRITKVILEQKIRFAREGLARIDFMELLKYTVPSFREDIRLLAFSGLLLLGGFRNKNILNYYFTTMKLDQSEHLKYELNKTLVKCIGIAAYNTIPSWLDDIEFLHSVNGEQSSESKVTNRLIQIEEATSAKMKSHSRLDELAKHTLQDCIEMLRGDLGQGKGLCTELWNTVHSCLVPINTRRNIFDIMMILYEPKNSFIITTDLPSDKKVTAKVISRVLNEEEENVGSLVISFRREARFKIQIPTAKLKLVEGKSKKNVASKESVKELMVLKKTDWVTVTRNARKLEVSIKIPKLQTKKVESSIIRHDSTSPLRYCKINLVSKSLILSTNDSFSSNLNKSEKLMVRFKVNPEKLIDLVPNAEKREVIQLVKTESTVDVSTAATVICTDFSSTTTSIEKRRSSLELKLAPSSTNDEVESKMSEASNKVSCETKDVLRTENSNIFDKLNPVKKSKSPSPTPKSSSPTPYSRSRVEEEAEKNSKNPKIKLKLN